MSDNEVKDNNEGVIKQLAQPYYSCNVNFCGDNEKKAMAFI